jgi:hypothetical protein
MGKSVHDDVLDAALDVIRTGCDKMTALSGAPAGYADASAVLVLAEAAMGTGDFTISDGDVSGRKVAVGEKDGVSVSGTGTATHVALLDTAGSRVLYVTTATAQALTSGNTMTFESWDIEIGDPA